MSFLHILLKFEIIWMRMGQLLDYDKLSIFLNGPVDLKWYKMFWNSL